MSAHIEPEIRCDLCKEPMREFIAPSVEVAEGSILISVVIADPSGKKSPDLCAVCLGYWLEQLVKTCMAAG